MDHTLTAVARQSNEAATDFLNSSDESFNHCRQRLISYLVKLNHALNENLQDLSQALVSRFCDSLVDYHSAGHFQVFQRLVPSPHSPRRYELAAQGIYAGALSEHSEFSLICSLNHGANLWRTNDRVRLFNWSHKSGEFSELVAAGFSPDGSLRVQRRPQ